MSDRAHNFPKALKVLLKEWTGGKITKSDVNDETMASLRKSLKKKGMNGGLGLQPEEMTHYLLAELRSRDVNKRYLILLIIDFLIRKLPRLRKYILTERIMEICEASCVLSGERRGSTSSSSMSHCVCLGDMGFRDNALEIFDRWDFDFGVNFPTLRAFCRYLRESQGYDLNHSIRAQNKNNEEAFDMTSVALESASGGVEEANEGIQGLTALFAILFPGVTDEEEEEEEEKDHRNRNKRKYQLSAGNNSSSSSSSSSSGLTDPSIKNIDISTIEWEDDDTVPAPSSSSTHKQSIIDFVNEVGVGTLDFSLDITVNVSENVVRSPDNAIIIDSIRELSLHLVKNILPRLLLWEKQIRDVEDNLSAEYLIRLNRLYPAAERSKILEELSSTAKRIKEILERRCKPLLRQSVQDRI